MPPGRTLDAGSFWTLCGAGLTDAPRRPQPRTHACYCARRVIGPRPGPWPTRTPRPVPPRPQTEAGPGADSHSPLVAVLLGRSPEWRAGQVICFAIKTASHITIECSVRHHGRRYINPERRPGETLHYFRAADDHRSKAGTTTYAQHHKRYDALLSMKTAFERNGALQSRDFETRRP